MELTSERLSALATMDDDVYDRQMYDGLITSDENVACTEWLKREALRLERHVARMSVEAAERREINRRLADQYADQTFAAQMEISRLQDHIRQVKAQNRERLIDYGVEAASRGEDPIEAMKEHALRMAMHWELFQRGYVTAEGRRTAKGRILFARMKAALAE